MHRFALEESRLIVRDRTLAPPVDFHFEAFDFDARGESLEDPLEIELSTNVTTGGRVVGGLVTKGQVSLAGAYDLVVDFEAIELAELQPFVSDATIAGRLFGTGEVVRRRRGRGLR